MSKLDVLRRIVDECDSTLKEAFLKRFDVTNQVAHAKIEEGRPIFDPNREKYVINNATAGLDSVNAARLTTLWTTILRMSRSNQYDIFVEKNGNSAMEFVKYSVDEMPFGDFAVSSAIPALNTSKYPFLGAPIPVQSDDEAYRYVISGETTYAIIKIKHAHDTEKLYDILTKNNLFVNLMIPLESGQTLVIISKSLVLDPQHNITTFVFQFANRAGELSKFLSIIADKHINMAFLRLSYDESYNTNIVTVDLEANLLDDNTIATLLQLQTEAPFFKVIGARRSLF